MIYQYTDLRNSIDDCMTGNDKDEWNMSLNKCVFCVYFYFHCESMRCNLLVKTDVVFLMISFKP